MASVAGRLDRRWPQFIAVCLVLFFAMGLFVCTAPPSYAQEEGNPAAGQLEAKGEPPAVQQNLLWHILKSAGIFFGPLLLMVSVGLVALIVLLAMDLRLIVAIPPSFVDEFTETVNKRKFREAFEMARNDNSFVGRVLTAGMGRLQYGIDDARETAFHAVESVKASKEQLITYLATIGSLGPMVGLVGTVYGMILAFMELSIPGKTPNPQRLADGISHALVITLLGIGIAVPAIFCHAFFKNRLTRISMDAANIADDLLTQMYHNSKRPAAPAPTTTAGSAGASPSPDARGPAVGTAVKTAEA
jgi:biopolymer transport protein ExbB